MSGWISNEEAQKARIIELEADVKELATDRLNWKRLANERAGEFKDANLKLRKELVKAESRIEELQEHIRDQAKGHQTDAWCWQSERTNLSKQIEELEAELSAQTAIIKGAPWYKDIEILQKEKSELNERVNFLEKELNRETNRYYGILDERDRLHRALEEILAQFPKDYNVRITDIAHAALIMPKPFQQEPDMLKKCSRCLWTYGEHATDGWCPTRKGFSSTYRFSGEEYCDHEHLDGLKPENGLPSCRKCGERVDPFREVRHLLNKTFSKADEEK